VVESASWKWLPVHDIARRLELDEAIVEEAVRRAVEKGWFEATTDRPLQVRLRSDWLDLR
jgi:DNA-binding MarR family transcriptional regulator